MKWQVKIQPTTILPKVIGCISTLSISLAGFLLWSFLGAAWPGRLECCFAWAPGCSSPPGLPGKASFPWLFFSAGLSWGGKAAPCVWLSPHSETAVSSPGRASFP